MVKRSAAQQTNGQNSAGKRAKMQHVPGEEKRPGILKKEGSARDASKPSSKGAQVQVNGSSKGKERASEGAGVPDGAASPAFELFRKPATAFEVIAGSYERLLYGLHCSLSGSGRDAIIDIQPMFQFPAHLNCVKAVHASPNGRFLVTGAADEVIKLWDLRRRKEVGGLLAHESDITSLTFPSDKYLVSTSADGTLALFRTKDWSLLRKFKGHKGKVNHVAVHPQGRVALSVGKDRCLRMWDLLGRSTGKSSSSTKLGAEGEIVRWNTAGTRFAVVLDREIRIFSTGLDLLHTLSSRSRFHDVQFVDLDGQESLLVACDDGKARFYCGIQKLISAERDEDEPLPALTCFAELTGHKNRIKSVCVVSVLNQQVATTVSSDGTVNMYSLASVSITSQQGDGSTPQTVSPNATYDTKGSRLTCLSVVAVSGDRTTAASVTAGMSDDGDESSDGSVQSDSDEDALEQSEEASSADDLEHGGEDEGAEWGGIEEQ